MKQDHIEQLEALMTDLAGIRHRFISIEGGTPLAQRWPSTYEGIAQNIHETISDIADFLAEYLRQEPQADKPDGVE